MYYIHVHVYPYAVYCAYTGPPTFGRFGDEGCRYLCEGLYGNETLLSLSLNYCGLTALSAERMGRIIATTAVR